MKKKCFIIVYIICILFTFIFNYNVVLAEGEEVDLSSIYDPITQQDGNPLYAPAEIIVGIIKWVGVAVLIGAIMLKGIKYVTVSPDGKAEIKKDIIMLTIGAILLFSFTTLIDIVYELVQKSGLSA